MLVILFDRVRTFFGDFPEVLLWVDVVVLMWLVVVERGKLIFIPPRVVIHFRQNPILLFNYYFYSLSAPNFTIIITQVVYISSLLQICLIQS